MGTYVRRLAKAELERYVQTREEAVEAYRREGAASNVVWRPVITHCICWELGATGSGQRHTLCRAHDDDGREGVAS